MDGRRRPASSFNRAAPGSFAPGGGGGGPSGPGARPTSAGKRFGEAQGGGHGWGKDRRSYNSDSSGLTRQASAPNLVPTANQNMSFDSFARSSPNHHAGGGGYDSFARSPGLRRSASATAVGPRGVPGLRSGGFSSAPRRRPYDNPSAYATPEREFGGRSGPPGSGGPGGGGFQHRADALQLESRLTEKLREHSLSANDGAARRPMAGTRGGRMGSSMWPSHSWQDDELRKQRMEDSYGVHEGGSYSKQYQAPPARFDPRSPNNMAGSRSMHGGSGGDRGGMGGNRRPPSSVPTPSMSPDQYASRSAQRRPFGQDSFVGGGSAAPTPPQLRSDMSMTGLTDSGGLPESRLKIYSDLFEEVIERDRVFGSLLRKIKTAYDMLLVRQPAVPPFPMDASSLPHHGHSHEGMDQHSWAGQDNRGPSSLHSNEPTTRAEGGQGWEMQRENRVLKDLVERLHLELEEAVRREHRWKQKVTKLKTKVETSELRHSPSQGADPGFYSKIHKVADDWICNPPDHQDPYSQGGHLQHDDPRIAEAQKMMSSSGGVPRFHSAAREPNLGEYGHEGPLNQGGLLSLSSISPTASVPPLPESFAQESARSEDSGQLPQKPRTRLPKPSNVPPLDFSRLKDAMEEGEEEEEEGSEGEEGQDEQGYDDDDLEWEEMQAHGKIARELNKPPEEYDDASDEDACWPSFERCSIRDAGHICHPLAKAMMERPQNPNGYSDASDEEMPSDENVMLEGVSRHSH